MYCQGIQSHKMFFEDVKGMTHKSPQLKQKASQKLKIIVLQLSQQKTKIGKVC